MNNQPGDPVALYPLKEPTDPLEEALSQLSHLSEEHRKSAAIQLMNQLHLAEKTEVAQQAGLLAVNQRTRDFVMRTVVLSFVFILIGSFLAFVLFSYLQVKADLLFTLITTTGGFLAGLLVPNPGSWRSNSP